MDKLPGVAGHTWTEKRRSHSPDSRRDQAKGPGTHSTTESRCALLKSLKLPQPDVFATIRARKGQTELEDARIGKRAASVPSGETSEKPWKELPTKRHHPKAQRNSPRRDGRWWRVVTAARRHAVARGTLTITLEMTWTHHQQESYWKRSPKVSPPETHKGENREFIAHIRRTHGEQGR